MNQYCGKQKGLGYKPSPNCYQTVVVEVSHTFLTVALKQKGLGDNQVLITTKQAVLIIAQN